MFWLLLALVGLLGRGVFLVMPVNSDSSLFIFMGRLIATGGSYGVDLLDTKFHSVGLLMSLPWRGLGASWWAWGVLGMTLATLAGLCLARSVDRGVVGHSAFWPTFAVALLLLGNPSIVGGLFQLETIMVLGTCSSALFGLRGIEQRRWGAMAVAGLCAATAALAKPSALGVLGAIALAVVWSSSAWKIKAKMLLAMVVGTMPPVATFFSYPLMTGTWGEFVFIFEQIRLYARNSASEPGLWLRVVVMGGVMLLPAMVAWVHHRKVGGSVPVVFAVAWLLIETVGVIGQARLYAYHFLVMVPPSVLLFGLAVRGLGFRQQVRAAAVGVVLSISQTAAVAMEIKPDAMRPVIDDARAIIAKHGGRVWGDDWSRLALELGTEAPSRVPLLFQWTFYDDVSHVLEPVLRQDIEAQLPTVLVLPADIDAHVTQMRTSNREFAIRVRGDGLARTWGWIRQLRDQRYKRVSRHGRVEVYQLLSFDEG